MEPHGTPIRILVADPLDLVAEGLRKRLADLDDMTVVAHAGTGLRVLELLSRMPIDLVLLEVSLPGMDGIDTMRAIRKEHPSMRVLAHSTLSDIEYVNSMLTEGAGGYLMKGATEQEFQIAVRTVMDGGRYLSEEARCSVEAGYAHTEKRMDGEYIGLTAREREIIRLVALERTNGEIAAQLFISEDTVKTHRKHLMTKLNVRSSAGLVKYAIDRRWV
ncbi:MAG: response regulator transcription factor [Flavobacteriales bacterium]|jgi:DNA-binding NarL/FixJ family response regulator|nr:response regulator transcription factor [Flavobacteriales bacterium]MBK9514832.1 response regulator transcription factor [Flavobacteriales bacterium]MBP7449222.1 response regulator transcription factor [Flavobacteriales bacterium]HOZ40204.1 response regulator transcription factor [Flavobacteriales bacterium]